MPEILSKYDTSIEGLFIIECKRHEDERGAFVKVFHKDIFEDNGLQTNFVESYYSVSKLNVIRGMHFQIPPKQCAKLVYVTKGKICDVVIDLRKNSKTSGRFFSMELSDTNNKMLYIPEGFAHGFKTLSGKAMVTYLQTGVYDAGCDSGVLWNSFGFDWQINGPVISQRDASFQTLNDFLNSQNNHF